MNIPISFKREDSEEDNKATEGQGVTEEESIETGSFVSTDVTPRRG